MADSRTGEGSTYNEPGHSKAKNTGDSEETRQRARGPAKPLSGWVNKVHSKFPWVHTDVNWIYKWQKIDKSFVQKIFKSCSSLQRRWSLNSLRGVRAAFLDFWRERMGEGGENTLHGKLDTSDLSPVIQVSTTSDELCWQPVSLIVCDERYFTSGLSPKVFYAVYTWLKTFEKLHWMTAYHVPNQSCSRLPRPSKSRKARSVSAKEEPRKCDQWMQWVSVWHPGTEEGH